MQLQCNYN